MIAESGRVLLDMLFREGEEVCVSPDSFGYHSISLSSLDYGTIELVSPSTNVDDKIIDTSEIKLIAINPTKGFRRDENVTEHRNFLVEIDDMPLADQLKYADGMGLPYSICVFSGNKSMHFAICLETPLPSYKMYYYYATWILAVMSKADQKTKNPTRSIRFAGAMRDGKEQKLVKVNKRIGLDELNAWLSQYEGFRPKEFDSTAKVILPKDSRNIPDWMWNKLNYGIDPSKGRNAEWFKLAVELGKRGYDAEDAVSFLEGYFNSEFDFKRNEWVTSIKSGIKYGRNKVGLESS
jgi:hypothetical protein